MKRDLVRFGVAIEPELLEQLDALAVSRNCTRSELLRDLGRREVAEVATQKRVPAVASVTLVYNHHVRQLSERLADVQHDLGEQVRSTMHVHLDHDNCIEVIVLRGYSDELQKAAQEMLAIRGVTHGGIEMVTERALAQSRSHRHGASAEVHAHLPARTKRGHGQTVAAQPRRALKKPRPA